MSYQATKRHGGSLNEYLVKKAVKKVTYYAIPIIWYLGKDETIGAKRLVAISLATMNR